MDKYGLVILFRWAVPMMSRRPSAKSDGDTKLLRDCENALRVHVDACCMLLITH